MFCATRISISPRQRYRWIGRTLAAAVEHLPIVWLEPDRTRWRYEPKCVSAEPHPHVEGRDLSNGRQLGYPLVTVDRE